MSCEHGARRVTRREHDGSVRVLADRFEDQRLNSPNDVVVTADGAVWFTDPSYGIRTDYEGHQAAEEIGGRHVYRIGSDGALTAVLTDFRQPNGLAFSADELRLFVVDSERHQIWAYDVEDLELRNGRLFADDELGYDGIRFDAGGRLWAAAHDGLHCYEADGTMSGKLLVPEITSNLAFGGLARQSALPDRDHVAVHAAGELPRRPLSRPDGDLEPVTTATREMVRPTPDSVLLRDGGKAEVVQAARARSPRCAASPPSSACRHHSACLRRRQRLARRSRAGRRPGPAWRPCSPRGR